MTLLANSGQVHPVSDIMSNFSQVHTIRALMLLQDIQIQKTAKNCYISYFSHCSGDQLVKTTAYLRTNSSLTYKQQVTIQMPKLVIFLNLHIIYCTISVYSDNKILK